MTCPRCDIDYNQKVWEHCPHCGEGMPAVTAGLLRTSTILISAGVPTGAGVYRSVEEVPEPLRKLLEQSTTGRNSATILIADRRGRTEMPRPIVKMSLPSNGAYRDSWRSPSSFVFGAVLAGFATVVGWLVCVHTW